MQFGSATLASHERTQSVASGRCSGMRNYSPIAPRSAFDGQLSGIVERIKRLLKAIAIDVLAEIALLIKEADPDNWDLPNHLLPSAGLPPHCPAPGVDWERLAQHEFPAEVRDARGRRSGVRRLKPRRPIFHRAFFAEHLVGLLAKNGVSKRVLDRLSRKRSEALPRDCVSVSRVPDRVVSRARRSRGSNTSVDPTLARWAQPAEALRLHFPSIHG